MTRRRPDDLGSWEAELVRTLRRARRDVERNEDVINTLFLGGMALAFWLGDRFKPIQSVRVLVADGSGEAVDLELRAGEGLWLVAEAHTAGYRPRLRFTSHDAPGRFSWWSSDHTVATVTRRGLLRALWPGRATIVARVGSIYSPPVAVYVGPRVPSARRKASTGGAGDPSRDA